MRTKQLFPIMVALTAIVLLGCPNPATPATPATDTAITLAAIPGVTTPLLGSTPVTTITETTQYTGTVAWNGSPMTFAASTMYTATITLTAKAGYTLNGVAADFFTVAGATSDSNPVNSGVVTAVFPATGASQDSVINIAAILGVPTPVLGATPVTTITETAQYAGTVAWSDAPVTFTASTVYTATITLTARASYTLTGVAANFFTVAGAISDTNAVSSGVVTAVFPATAAIVSGTIGNIMAVTGGSFNNGTANMTVSSFRISQHEITGEQYAAVMSVIDPSNHASVTSNPVEMVTWYDAVEFCNKLSTNESLTTVYTITGRTPVTGYPITSATVTANWSANGYRLPTEAEWQFSARGGNSSKNLTYAGSNTLGDVAWNHVNSGSTTHTVGTKAPNELGLYDMSGNVREWCWDLNGDYPTTAQTDYRGATSGSTYRIRRGGSYLGGDSDCTVATRGSHAPYYQSSTYGFRVVRP